MSRYSLLLTRRSFLAGAMGLLWSGAASVRADTGPNPVSAENQLPGNPDWLTNNPANNREIEGYASQAGAGAGDNVKLFVSTSASSFMVSLYRMGWYGGAGARRVAQFGPVTGMKQTMPTTDTTTGLVECNWVSQLTVTIDPSWTTGLYMFRLERPDGVQSYIPLVIRSQQTNSALILQCATNTYQGYNTWGGESFYVTQTGGSVRPRANIVSFDRPYDSYDYAAIGSGQALEWEYPAIRWFEQQGYDISYTCDNDIHAGIVSLNGHKAALIVGHSEYWSRQMYDASQNARDAGVNMFYMGGNTCYWQVRVTDSALGTNRRLTTYKDQITRDPMYGVNNSMVTTTWGSALLDRPESSLTGAQYAGYIHAIPYTNVKLTFQNDPEFAGIAVPLPAASPLAGGYEFETVWPNGTQPPGVEILGVTPVVSAQSMPGVSHALRYKAPSGAMVFNAASIAWAFGLDSWRTTLERRANPPSDVIRQLTTQLLGDALNLPVTPTGAMPLNQVVRIVPGPLYMEPGQTMKFAATVGSRLTTGGGVTWQIAEGPSIATIDSGGNLHIASGAADGTQIHLTATSILYPASSDSAVVTVQTPRTWQSNRYTGNDRIAYTDGPVSSAQFLRPYHLCVDGSGIVYCIDTDAQAVRYVSGGFVRTLAGGAGNASGVDSVSPGFKDGTGTAAQFNQPSGAALSNGLLYVTDTMNHAIRQVTAGGVVTTLSGNGTYGFVNGTLAQARFSMPTGIAVDPSGNLYIADTGNHAIRRISPNGVVATLAGTGAMGMVDGSPGTSQLYYPMGLIWTNSGLVIGDTGNHAVRLLRPDNTLMTLAGTGKAGYQDGLASEAQFFFPMAVLLHPSGAILVADRYNHVVRSIDPVAGAVSTILGSGFGGERSGGDLSAQFNLPVGLATGPDGSIYLTDNSDIYRITPKAIASGIAYLNLSPSTVLGGLGVTGTLSLDGVAAASFTAILSTTNTAATVPPTVTVPAGSSSASFAISTQSVSNVVTGVVTAALNGTTLNANLTVRSGGPLSVGFNPATVQGGQSSTGTVTLESPAGSGGVTVALSSGDPSAAVPAGINIPSGSATGTFTVTTTAVGSQKIVTITATSGGLSASNTLTILPVGLGSLTVNPYRVMGGQSTTGTVTLNAAAAGDVVVSLSSTNPWASPPPTVTVLSGHTSATFPIATQPVTDEDDGYIVATANGTTMQAYIVVRPIGPLSLALNPDTVNGGQSSTGTVTLEAPAAPGDTIVTVSASDPAAMPPASFTIPAGNTAGTFPIPTAAITSAKNVSITVTVHGRATSKTLVIKASTSVGLLSVSANPSTVLGGAGSTGTVTLNANAPSNTVVSLSTGITGVSVPSTVTVLSGNSSATFPITTQPVAATVTGNITATLNGTSVNGSLTVRAVKVTSLSLNPTSVTGGQSSTGTVTLEAAAAPGNITVSLSSSDPSATVPASTVVPAGQTTGTFTVTTVSVTSTKTATITASANGGSANATLTVQPPAVMPALVSVSSNPSSVLGGSGSTGTVTLDMTAPSDTVVSLSSGNPAASVPATVMVLSGNASATFPITTQPVTSTTTGNITATLNGNSVNGSITVRAESPLSVSLNPTSVTGGQSSTGTVTLEAPAAPGDITVSLSSSDPSATVPSNIIITAGSTTGAFMATTTPVTSTKTATITATTNGGSANATLTVQPPVVTLVPVSVSANPSSVLGGAGSTGTVTLNATAPTDTVVSLSSGVAGASVPATVTVLSGNASATFPITTQSVATTVTGNITATLNGTSANGSLTVRAIKVVSVSLNPTSVTGGQSSTGTVTLEAAAAPGNITVSLSSSDPSAVVPASITITAGQTTGTFTATTVSVTSTKTATITAATNGGSANATLTVVPAGSTGKLSAISVSPGTVMGGTSATCTVTLTAAATQDTLVAMSSNNPAAVPPANVTVLSGAKTATFAVPTVPVAAQVTASLTATLNGTTKSTSLAVRPIGPLSLALAPETVKGGNSSVATVTLEAPSAPGDTVVTISSNNIKAVPPASITILAGKTSGQFTITTSAVLVKTNVTITVTAHGRATTKTLVITV